MRDHPAALRQQRTGPRLAVCGPQHPMRRERALFEQYAQRRDPYTRGALVERFLPLASSLARRYEHLGEPFDDLLQSRRWRS